MHRHTHTQKENNKTGCTLTFGGQCILNNVTKEFLTRWIKFYKSPMACAQLVFTLTFFEVTFISIDKNDLLLNFLFLLFPLFTCCQEHVTDVVIGYITSEGVWCNSTFWFINYMMELHNNSKDNRFKRSEIEAGYSMNMYKNFKYK